ncbi:MAG: M23 family metallopeptidase [Xenococcus sp. (in: cyanobacteria)]
MKLKIPRNRQIIFLVGTIIFAIGLTQLQSVPSQALDNRIHNNLITLPNEYLSTLQPPTEIVSNLWEHASFPVENFQSYTSPFGYRRSPVDGEIQFHNGLDLAAPLGSYIRNWWTGKVTKVAYDETCGTSITIQSGDWQHVYCHLEGTVEKSDKGRYLIDRSGAIQIRQGQNVTVGARIGRVGMTGRTTGPHLHWVLRHNGKYVDPALVIKEMFKQNASLMPNRENLS